jgi:hypothetical protein
VAGSATPRPPARWLGVRRVLLLSLLAVLAVAPAARAEPVVGIGDQSYTMFQSPLFAALDVPISRLVVSYDAVLEDTFEVPYVDAWLSEAAKRGVEPLIAFNYARGCYDGRVSRARRCRAPDLRRYRAAVRAFRARYPHVRRYQPWNEANHRSQPTYRRPRLAARMFDFLRRDCPRCTVTGADLLDQRDMVAYARAFARHARHRVRIWGLHNYTDVGHRERSRTRRLLRAVRGRLWLTETGGIVKFADKHRYDPQRARRGLAFLFELIRMSPRIDRVYLYQWTGVPRRARFDAGLTHPDGTARPGYRVVLRHLRRSQPPAALDPSRRR